MSEIEKPKKGDTRLWNTDAQTPLSSTQSSTQPSAPEFRLTHLLEQIETQAMDLKQCFKNQKNIKPVLNYIQVLAHVTNPDHVPYKNHAGYQDLTVDLKSFMETTMVALGHNQEPLMLKGLSETDKLLLKAGMIELADWVKQIPDLGPELNDKQTNRNKNSNRA